jgi:hypothetical protein
MTAEPQIQVEVGTSSTPDGGEQAHGHLAPLPASLDLMTAAGLLGIGRTCAYGLVSRGRWPTPVIRVGRCIRIPTQPLLALLELDPTVIHRPLASAGGNGAPVGH